jgi:hypothetical protein
MKTRKAQIYAINRMAENIMSNIKKKKQQKDKQ